MSSTRPDLLDPDTLLTTVRFDDRGLVPVVVQEATTRDVLMLAWMDAESVRRTMATGRATYWSRSRQEHWVKGATSGNTQHVRDLRADCDGDTLLLVVDQHGPACHTGAATCFDAATGAAGRTGATAATAATTDGSDVAVRGRDA